MRRVRVRVRARHAYTKSLRRLSLGNICSPPAPVLAPVPVPLAVRIRICDQPQFYLQVGLTLTIILTVTITVILLATLTLITSNPYQDPYHDPDLNLIAFNPYQDPYQDPDSNPIFMSEILPSRSRNVTETAGPFITRRTLTLTLSLIGDSRPIYNPKS